MENENKEPCLGDEGTCACGKPGVWMFDPYDQDVHNTNTKVCYCPECEQRSCDDI